MKLNELRSIQKQIIAKATRDDDAVPDEDRLNFEEVFVSRISAQASRLTTTRRFLNHQEAREVISALSRFYDRITPTDAALLSLQTYVCLNCHEHLTEDEYPAIPYSAYEMIRQLYPNYLPYGGTRDVHAYCKKCIHRVPLMKYRKDRPGFVYLAITEDGYKLGRSKNPDKRAVSLRGEYGKTEMLGSISVGDDYIAERHLHLIFWHKYLERELFDLSPEDVARFMEMVNER